MARKTRGRPSKLRVQDVTISQARKAFINSPGSRGTPRRALEIAWDKMPLATKLGWSNFK